MNQLEKEMTEHLRDFPKRREALLEFQEKTLQNDEAIMRDVAAVKKQIAEGLTHPKSSAQTIAMVGGLKDVVMEHNKRSEEIISGYMSWRQETNQALAQLSELMPIVREQLLPAYQREMDRKKAREIVRADFESFSFWAKGWLLVAATVTSVGVIIKFWILK